MDGTLARALLGVPTHADPDLIGRAFRVAAFDAHPDRGGDALRFRQLLAARDFLLATATEAPNPARDPFSAHRQPARTCTVDLADIVRRRPEVVPAPAHDTFDQVLARVMAA